jgi:predicted signal transduction protein with EAL and GGDEF domain/CHASE2 domain-containing sensor protein
MATWPAFVRKWSPARKWPVATAVARNVVWGLFIVFALALGAFAPLDRFLSDIRFGLARSPVSNRIATVEIDSQSLTEVGVWPWPRALHGALVDRLVALGARRIVFDIDFSAASTPDNDRAFAAAIERAKGKVWLATFEQDGGAYGKASVNAPIPLLSQHARTVSIDVPLAPDGFVREYDTSRIVSGWSLPTAGALLADRSGAAPRRFGIDYGLNVEQLTRLSAADVLAGRAPRILVEGRDIIVGASAEELRDFFMTPRGVTPALVVHALGAETMLMARELRPTPRLAVIALILALALVAGAWERRLSPLGSALFLALVALGVEAGGLALQKWAALMTPTAGVQVALAVFALSGLVAALRLRRRMHSEAAQERDGARAMLNQVIADNFDGVVVIGDDGRILEASRPALDIVNRGLRHRSFKVLPSELADAVGAALAAPGRVEHVGEARLAGRSGDLRHLEYAVTVSTVPEAPDRRVACLTFRDVTERRAHLARLDYLARHDEGTGAFTRGEFQGRVLRRLAAEAEDLAVFCLALRRFDLVNDVFGHRVGDRLLGMAVERLRDLELAEIARLNGAVFAFVASGASDPVTLTALGAKIIARIAEPYRVDGHPVIVGASLGATTVASSGANVGTLLSHASMAQAAAARRIGDVFEMFSPDMETRRREKQALDADLRQAIADGALALNFQAKVDLADGRAIGAEALMRWRKADGAFVSPASFIPVAEESGLIVELGRFALRRACAEATLWPQSSVVAVNVSPVQFGLSDVFADVCDALTAAGLEPRRLELEITESAFADGDSAISSTLAKLRVLGVKIALDDFGTGYSSMHYLGRLPIDTIKIDQSFVRAMRTEPTAAATVGAIVALAKAHGKSLVAEGIETAADAAQLAAMGCEYGQGYHFGRPMDGPAFAAVINGERAAA